MLMNSKISRSNPFRKFLNPSTGTKENYYHHSQKLNLTCDNISDKDPYIPPIIQKYIRKNTVNDSFLKFNIL